MTALVEAKASDVTPALRPASSSAAVPATLVAKVSSGCSSERSTEVTAARWTIESKPPANARLEDRRVSDVADHHVHGRVGVRCRSTTRTWAPSAVSSDTTWRPMKPEPPVTRTRRPASDCVRGRGGAHFAQPCVFIQTTPIPSIDVTDNSARLHPRMSVRGYCDRGRRGAAQSSITRDGTRALARPSEPAVSPAGGRAGALVPLLAIPVCARVVTQVRPGYDPYGWLVLGPPDPARQAGHQRRAVLEAVPFLFTLPYALVGRDALYLWMTTAFASRSAAWCSPARVAYRLVARPPGAATPVGRGLVAASLACRHRSLPPRAAQRRVRHDDRRAVPGRGRLHPAPTPPLGLLGAVAGGPGTAGGVVAHSGSTSCGPGEGAGACAGSCCSA